MALREEQAELRGLVRRLQLLPGPLGPFELRERGGRVASGQEDRPPDAGGERLDRRGRLAAHEAVELGRRGRGGLEVVGGEGDLRLRGQEPDAQTVVPARLGQRLADPGGRGVHPPLEQAEQRQAGLRGEAELVGSREGLLRHGEVTHPAPDLADLVVRGPECRSSS